MPLGYAAFKAPASCQRRDNALAIEAGELQLAAGKVIGGRGVD
jgi:hypothetical protein